MAAKDLTAIGLEILQTARNELYLNLPYLDVALCSLDFQPGGGVTLERKGSGHMFLEIMGISAHAGRCYQDGASAILELAHKILAFDAYVDLDHDTTVNTGLVNGGTSANSVAPNASGRVR